MPNHVLASLRNGNAARSGVGISGVRERTLQLNGNLKIIERHPGTGIRIEIPLKINACESKTAEKKMRAAAPYI